MKYTDGWKYRVEQGFAYRLHHDYQLAADAVTPWFTITARTPEMPFNWLLVQPGYASDGATMFPDFDWIKTAAIAVHDPLCQAIEMGILPESFNDLIDDEMSRAIAGESVSRPLKRKAAQLRSWYVKKGINLADSEEGKSKPVKELPRLPDERTLDEYNQLREKRWKE